LRETWLERRSCGDARARSSNRSRKDKFGTRRKVHNGPRHEEQREMSPASTPPPAPDRQLAAGRIQTGAACIARTTQKRLLSTPGRRRASTAHRCRDFPLFALEDFRDSSPLAGLPLWNERCRDILHYF